MTACLKVPTLSSPVFLPGVPSLPTRENTLRSEGQWGVGHSLPVPPLQASRGSSASSQGAEVALEGAPGHWRDLYPTLLRTSSYLLIFMTLPRFLGLGFLPTHL